jgi:DNA-binding NarL/FixJ family response regulator
MGDIRVLVADDDEMVRTMLAALISSEPALELAGAARDTGEAVALAAAEQPDIALLDLDMPGGAGYRAAEEIGARSARTQIIALTARDAREARQGVMRSGAVSFIAKGSPNDEIVDAIRSAVRWRSDADGRRARTPGGPAPGRPAGNGAGSLERVAALEDRVASLERAIVRLVTGEGAGDGARRG